MTQCQQGPRYRGRVRGKNEKWDWALVCKMNTACQTRLSDTRTYEQPRHPWLRLLCNNHRRGGGSTAQEHFNGDCWGTDEWLQHPHKKVPKKPTPPCNNIFGLGKTESRSSEKISESGLIHWFLPESAVMALINPPIKLAQCFFSFYCQTVSWRLSPSPLWV